jgi:lysophospholipase L1-like esterase
MTRKRKLIYALFTVLALLGLAEGTLRLAGFRYQRVTTYLQFNYPRPGFLKAFFEIDPDLLYRIRPTVKQRYAHLTWQPRFDLKIRDPRTFGAKPPGTIRIVALGDSSTYGVNTEEPWPWLLQRRLDGSGGPGRFQVLNLGVPGYTAFQGRRVLETRGERLEPDVVVVYFGWNDHILALGYADEDQRVGGETVVATRNLLAASRLYQALSWLVATLRGEPGPDGRAPRTEPEGGDGVDPLLAPKRRVGPRAFARELRAMVAVSRALGAVPVLCTYPTALTYLTQHELAPPGWLAETHVGYGGLDEVVRLQDLYNLAVHEIGRETGSPVLDLDAAFRRRGVGSLFDEPGGDMIHPSRQGYALIAEMVYQALPALGAGR